ncbi:ATP-binding cassette domain-containing protein [Mycoplasma buteonis]|uniref:ATP-binding cassette domain-containing protein n=1 Tax=Mycoplasma buteonis TaxID=171280 RepID=UPI00068F44AB|nr:ABC transporter ATP-binding protein [Mycoplasma buteonis]
MVNFLNVNLSYNDKDIVLENLNFSFSSGSIIGFIGKSGCGKTTLLKSCFNTNLIHSGQITINDVELNRKSSKKDLKKYKKSIVFLDQENLILEEYDFYHNFLWKFNNYKNIFYKFFRLLSAENKENLEKWLDIFEIKELLFTPMQNLSSGQKQRFNLLFAFLNNSQLILADEPTSNLDVYYSDLALKELSKLVKEKQKTFLMSIHDLDLAIKYCDYLVAIKNGQIQKIYSKDNFEINEIINYFD